MRNSTERTKVGRDDMGDHAGKEGGETTIDITNALTIFIEEWITITITQFTLEIIYGFRKCLFR